MCKMLTKHGKSDTTNELSYWCTAVMDGKEKRVRIRHIGRGRFLVLEPENSSQHTIIDASDILHCDA
jgi:hypothetical protein